MPRAKIKALEAVDPLISDAFHKAMASPGQRIVVAANVSNAVATNLQVRMRAVRQGFLTFYHEDHEYHRAAKYNRIWIEREYDSKFPDFRTVTIRYSGLIKRPSEVATEYMKKLAENPQVRPIMD